jgi:hypothetical protein
MTTRRQILITNLIARHNAMQLSQLLQQATPMQPVVKPKRQIVFERSGFNTPNSKRRNRRLCK